MQKKKKKALRRELIIGGGAMVILLPVILFAILGAGAAILVGFLLARQIPDTNVVLTMLTVYGTLLVLLLVFAYKFSARLLAIIRRMVNIRREQRRVQAEFTRLEDHENERADDTGDFLAGEQHAD